MQELERSKESFPDFKRRVTLPRTGRYLAIKNSQTGMRLCLEAGRLLLRGCGPLPIEITKMSTRLLFSAANTPPRGAWARSRTASSTSCWSRSPRWGDSAHEDARQVFLHLLPNRERPASARSADHLPAPARSRNRDPRSIAQSVRISCAIDQKP